MIPTKLYTRSGHYVITVMVPPFRPPAEAIVWGSRIFFRHRQDGKYFEGLAFHVTEMLEVPPESDGAKT